MQAIDTFYQKMVDKLFKLLSRTRSAHEHEAIASKQKVADFTSKFGILVINVSSLHLNQDKKRYLEEYFTTEEAWRDQIAEVAQKRFGVRMLCVHDHEWYMYGAEEACIKSLKYLGHLIYVLMTYYACYLLEQYADGAPKESETLVKSAFAEGFMAYIKTLKLSGGHASTQDLLRSIAKYKTLLLDSPVEGATEEEPEEKVVEQQKPAEVQQAQVEAMQERIAAYMAGQQAGARIKDFLQQEIT